MTEKKCQVCGKSFKPEKEHHKKCPKCFQIQRTDTGKTTLFEEKKSALPDIDELLLEEYYDSEKNKVMEIYIGCPEKLAMLFHQERMSIKQLRDFLSRVAGARKRALFEGIERARSILWECIPHAEYQRKRKSANGIPLISESFFRFIKHHINKAVESEENLEAFYEHFDSIVCYFPRNN